MKKTKTKTKTTKQHKCSESELSKTMVLQLAQKNFAAAGIVPNLTAQPYPLNGRILLGFLTLGLAAICNFKYGFYDANTFIEYTQSIFMSSLTIIVNFALLNLSVKVKKLFKFINDADDAGVFGECPLAQACFSNTI